MKNSFLIFLSTLVAASSFAQTDELHRRYDEFKRQAGTEYADFRQRANREYATYMRQAWQEYNISPALPRPKDEKVPPITMPEKDKARPVKEHPVTIEDIIVPPAPLPHPVPVAPVREQPQPTAPKATFRFFGTGCKVRFDNSVKFSLSGRDEKALSAAWNRLSGKTYDNTVLDCLELRKQMQLCDWAYLNLLDSMSQACLGKTDEATLFMAFIYCQSGYKMRLGRTPERLVLLYASAHSIYDRPFFSIGSDKFYPFGHSPQRLSVCSATFPKEQPLSLLLPRQPRLAQTQTNERQLHSQRYPEVRATVRTNENLIRFYETYPSSETDGNCMTRWAAYANTPLEEEARETLYPALLKNIAGLTAKEAAERLLNFVQTAFVYEYDDKVWGGDRAFFAEETLYYPYCDCEDRSILFSRLIRDLLRLDVLLVYYPGHLATAVHFPDSTAGDYVTVDGRRFTICDPTYIGAPVGRTMPGMENRTAKVIQLNP